jgi:hypothetical protein
MDCGEGEEEGSFRGWFKNAASRPRLSCAALLNLLSNGSLLSAGANRARMVETNQNIIGRILKTGARLMELTSRLRCQLAQLIAVLNMGKSPKDQIGTHW